MFDRDLQKQCSHYHGLRRWESDIFLGAARRSLLVAVVLWQMPLAHAGVEFLARFGARRFAGKRAAVAPRFA